MSVKLEVLRRISSSKDLENANFRNVFCFQVGLYSHFTYTSIQNSATDTSSIAVLRLRSFTEYVYPKYNKIIWHLITHPNKLLPENLVDRRLSRQSSEMNC